MKNKNLIVYKANELVVSRYDLSEQETRLVLFGLSKINNTLKEPTEKDMTLSLSYVDYAEFMNISQSLSWHNLHNGVKNLLGKVFELIDFDENGAPILTMRQWFSKADFNPYTQCVDLVFHKDLFPYLFNMKKFIKYKLENIKSLNNRYSMRMYEYFLKELGECKKGKRTFNISFEMLKTLLYLDGNYSEFKRFNQRVLKVVVKDINDNSDLKVSVKTQGRPVNMLIFTVEKAEQQLDIVQEIDKQEKTEAVKSSKPKKQKTLQQQTDQIRIDKTLLIISHHNCANISLSKKEYELLKNMENHFYKHGNFEQGKLSEKQLAFFDSVLNKYLPRMPSKKG